MIVRKIELCVTKEFVPDGKSKKGKYVAVAIDVLRATSTICSALGAGAKAVYFCDEIDEANALAEKLGRDNVVLGGERDIKKIDGFDLGNSPASYTYQTVGDKIVITTTTNGTKTLNKVKNAEAVIVGSFLNRAAVVSYLMDSEHDVMLVCSGRLGKFAVEDVLCAGSIIRELIYGTDGFELDDAANAAVYLAEYLDGQYLEVVEESASGKALSEAGLDSDVEFASALDKVQVVPLLDKEQGCLVPWSDE